MRRQFVLILGLGLALIGCGKDPTVVPVRNLERPADMGFVCMRLATTAEGPRLTGRPMVDCHPHLDAKISPQPPTEAVDFSQPRVMGTFGLVTNTARGELGVVDMDLGRLVDMDRSQPGFNMLPVGAFPEVMSASQDGCIVATANRGSCDLAVIDPQRLLSQTFAGQPASTGAGPMTTRVVPTTPSGRKLQVAPHEIAFLPQPVASLSQFAPATQQLPPESLCQSGGAYDRASPGTRAPWRAVVTFPSCDLVAVLELPSGTIVSSVYVRPTRVRAAGGGRRCRNRAGLPGRLRHRGGAPARARRRRDAGGERRRGHEPPARR